jgi:putative oxidoreductase
MNRELLFLSNLERFADIGLLVLRVLTGAFLIYGVIDNVVSSERMEEFVAFMAANGFPAPGFLAPISVYLQLLCGIAFLGGFLTRWAGIIIAVHFVVAVVMVHWAQDFRGWWPAIVLVGIGLQFALAGGGKFAIDTMIQDRPNK